MGRRLIRAWALVAVILAAGTAPGRSEAAVREPVLRQHTLVRYSDIDAYNYELFGRLAPVFHARLAVGDFSHCVYGPGDPDAEDKGGACEQLNNGVARTVRDLRAEAAATNPLADVFMGEVPTYLLQGRYAGLPGPTTSPSTLQLGTVDGQISYNPALFEGQPSDIAAAYAAPRPIPVSWIGEISIASVGPPRPGSDILLSLENRSGVAQTFDLTPFWNLVNEDVDPFIAGQYQGLVDYDETLTVTLAAGETVDISVFDGLWLQDRYERLGDGPDAGTELALLVRGLEGPLRELDASLRQVPARDESVARISYIPPFFDTPELQNIVGDPAAAEVPAVSPILRLVLGAMLLVIGSSRLRSAA
ncbi:MAG: hypothetical protein AB8G23_21850 [Myxococcota bacterium]